MRRKPILEVLNGPLAGRRIPLSSKLTIGRHPRMDVPLDDPAASRWHATVERSPDGCVVRDMKSSNGVFVGDDRVELRTLRDGDVIGVGKTRLRFSVPSGLGQADTVDSPPPKAPPVSLRSSVNATRIGDVRELIAGSYEEAASEGERELRRRLAAVFEANQVIASERSVKTVLTSVVDQVFALLPVSTAAVLLLREATGKLEVVHARHPEGMEGPAALSSTIVERVVRRGQALITTDAASDPRFGGGRSIVVHNISSAMCAPLACHGKVLGVLYVDARGLPGSFGYDDLELLVALAGPAGITLENAQYLERLERSYRESLVALANAIELRDHYTVGHTWRVTGFALRMARRLGWPQGRLDQVEMGGVLHDVGKIAVDDAILRKPGRLTDEEFEKMKVHPERGASLLQSISFLEPVVPYCLYHHERFDGGGYPFGLAGSEIPEEGRLIAVADAFDAMTSHRPYRAAMEPDEAARRIAQGSGTQFDPRFAEALIACYRAGELDEVLQEHPERGHGIACPYCSTHLPVSEEAADGDELSCQVCHCEVRLHVAGGEFTGVLMSRTGREDTDLFGMPGSEFGDDGIAIE